MIEMGFIIAFLFTIFFVVFIFITYYYIIPQKDLISVSQNPDTYFIQVSNRIDIQSNFECAAFSSAYVLRHFGIEADGNVLYRTFPKKLIDGTISPKGIIEFFTKRDYKASFLYGNINTLKQQVSKGVPVIALIKVFPNKPYLHYIPVIGYDQEYLYLADSLKFMVNCNQKLYNRRISINEFQKLWRTWVPFYKNTYIVVKKS